MNSTNEPLDSYLASIAERDPARLGALVDESVILLMPNGKLVIGKEAFVELHREWFKDRDWSWRTKVLASNRWSEGVNYLLHVEYSDKDEKGINTSFSYHLGLTFRKEAGRWLLTFDQNSLEQI